MDYKESDVEAAFAGYLSQRPRMKVIGQQIRLPLGIIDILATSTSDGTVYPVVVEVKKGIIDLSACGQLLGYMGQVDALNYCAHAEVLLALANEIKHPHCDGILVGSGIDQRAERVVLSMYNIIFCQYTVEDEQFKFIRGADPLDYDEESPYDPRLSNLISHLVELNRADLISDCLSGPGDPDLTHPPLWHGSPTVLRDSIEYYRPPKA